MKLPGPDHPITIEPNPARVTVSAAGRIIADSRNALTLREASYAAVHYIPLRDVNMTLLERTEHQTYCPYRAIALLQYFLGERSVNAVWTYEAPYVPSPRSGSRCFHPDRVDERFLFSNSFAGRFSCRDIACARPAPRYHLVSRHSCARKRSPHEVTDHNGSIVDCQLSAAMRLGLTSPRALHLQHPHIVALACGDALAQAGFGAERRARTQGARAIAK
jgi:uncharacterized protein (DUF427 family)